jgi:chorismate mutase
MNIAALPLVQWAGVAGMPLVIAGPCAAETEEQLMETAERVAAQGVGYLRAGIWKARTRPNSFEGIGERVQELAAALRGTTVPVLIKNPTNRDLALWLGAVERVYSAGVRALGVIHRGFSIRGQARFS